MTLPERLAEKWSGGSRYPWPKKWVEDAIVAAVHEALEGVEKAVNRANEAKHLGHYRSACCVAVDEVAAALKGEPNA